MTLAHFMPSVATGAVLVALWIYGWWVMQGRREWEEREKDRQDNG